MNIWDIEDAYIARLQPAAPAGILVVGTFDAIDWTNPAASPVLGMHVAFNGITPADETGRSALVTLGYSAHTYLDTGRATPADRTHAAACVRAALRAAIGWQWKTGLRASLAAGPQTGFDGRLARVSISFNVPAPEAGLA